MYMKLIETKASVKSGAIDSLFCLYLSLLLVLTYAKTETLTKNRYNLFYLAITVASSKRRLLNPEINMGPADRICLHLLLLRTAIYCSYYLSISLFSSSLPFVHKK